MDFLGNTHRIEETKCPKCGAILDEVSSGHSLAPDPGDLNVCIECGAVMIFERGLSVRLATDAEVATEWKVNSEFRALVRTMAAFREFKKAGSN